MGETDYRGYLEDWRLEISGHVETPVTLTFQEVLSLPSIEKNVLLICPGFFTNHGRWKGISLGKLIQKCGIKSRVTQVQIFGQDGEKEKKRFFPIGEVQSEDVFLAYAVNDVILPEKHGAPLRVVAGDYYGSDWIKYVHKISLERR
jgi:sulfoxide reductase catalytic subunit YedY